MSKEQAHRIMKEYIKNQTNDNLEIVKCTEKSNGTFNFLCKSKVDNDKNTKEMENCVFVVFNNGEVDCLTPPT